MNVFRVAAAFTIFFLGFFVAAILRFENVIATVDLPASSHLPLIVVAFFSGVVMAFGLGWLDLFTRAAWKKVIYGGVIGIILFFCIFAIEDALSERKLYHQFDAHSFAEVKGHCGVYIGRALIKAYHWSWNPSVKGILKDFRLGNRCRVERFLQLAKRKKIECKPDEDSVQCLVRWMPIFAERGYWNSDVRRMFLSEVARLYKDSKTPASTTKVSPESMIEYGLRDYELDVARPSLVKQAGLEEEFSDEFMYYKQADDLQNVILTRDVFEAVAWTLQNENAGPRESPQVTKFKETSKVIFFKTEKIPELEKDLAELKTRAQL